MSNKEKRAQYDRFGQTFEGAGAQPGFDFGFNPFDSMDFSDLFEDFFGFGSRVRGREINQGRDIEVEVKIDLADTLKNVQRRIKLSELVACQRCQGFGAEPGSKIKECFSCRGTGQVQQMKKTIFGTIARYIVCPECGGEGKIPEKPCNVCKGEGRISSDQDVEIFIPAGVDTGQTIKIAGKGEAGRRGGKPGDLYVRVFVRPHPLFERKGDDLYLTLAISFSQASLGDEIEVPTLEGKKILLKVPSGTESGEVFRISGKGIPYFSGFAKGNLYIELIIKTPKKLTKQQKELLEKLKEQGL